MAEAELNAVVAMKAEIAPGLFIIRVVPDAWPLPTFKSGQFAVLGLPASAPRIPRADPDDPATSGLIRRAYSIASSSADREYLEFYITVVSSGALTPRLAALSVGERLWLGPKITGMFTLDEIPAGANLVMLATGTGLAPYMSMLRTHLMAGDERRFGVIHGARHSWDLGYHAELAMTQRLSPRFVYIPVVSLPSEEPVPWHGGVGYVQDIWATRPMDQRWGFGPRPEHTHVLLCGNPLMIEAMTKLLEFEGYREHKRNSPGQIHVEKYW